MQYRLTPELTLLTGLLEQNPQAPSRSHAWSVSTDGSLGILLPLEAEWRTRRFGQPGIYSLGLLYTNAKQTDLYLGQSGGPGAKALNQNLRNAQTPSALPRPSLARGAAPPGLRCCSRSASPPGSVARTRPRRRPGRRHRRSAG
ncbi:carbohydrate porin [Chromobacterium alkanivorans]|uniref:carbohydrate porin n=1 Tax=Chromobacterium alkanivorans TaxID=1071719 RepID=UPI003B8A5B10